MNPELSESQCLAASAKHIPQGLPRPDYVSVPGQGPAGDTDMYTVVRGVGLCYDPFPSQWGWMSWALLVLEPVVSPAILVFHQHRLKGDRMS